MTRLLTQRPRITLSFKIWKLTDNRVPLRFESLLNPVECDFQRTRLIEPDSSKTGNLESDEFIVIDVLVLL